MRQRKKENETGRENYTDIQREEASMYRAALEKVKSCQPQMLSHQDGSEDSRTDAICHLKLSFFIGSCEVVVPPRTKHSKNKQEMRKKKSVSLTSECKDQKYS